MATKTKTPTAKAVVGEVIKQTGDNKGKGFDLGAYKKVKNLSTNSGFKPQEWLPVSDAFMEATGLGGIPMGHITVLRGLSDTGKAQPLTSKVLTPNGWVTMGDVSKGDVIMDSEGNHQTVEGVYPQGVRPVYKVTFDDHSVVMCDEEHLWEVNNYKKRNKGKKIKGVVYPTNDTGSFVMSTKELQSSVRYTQKDYDSHNYMIPVASPMNFVSQSNLPIDPYILGVMIGDGSLFSMVQVSTMDQEIIESCSKDEYYRTHVALKRRQPHHQIQYRVSFKKEIRPILKDLGLYKKYSEEKFIPSRYIYQATVEDRLSILQGLLDTDGTVTKQGVVEYNTSSETLKNSVIEIILSLGGVYSVRSKIPTYRSNGVLKNGLLSYTVTIRLPEYMKPFRLSRKMERLVFKRKHIRRYIKSIEYSHEEGCKCLLVSNPNHLYITDNYIVTHNTTLLLEGIVSAQKAGKLPVIIVTEMKWSFTHAAMMGMQLNEVVDEETGEVTYDGPFIYIDRSSLDTIEDVASFIADLLDEQAKGKLPYDLCFFWDAVGSIACKQSVESNKNNNEWNAGAISVNFGNFINQKIIMSRKSTYPYTNSFIVVNKVWIQKPMVYGELPKMKNKNGETFWSDCSILTTFGGVTSQGTSKIKAQKDGKEVEFGKRTKVQVEKNHITGITTSTRIIATPHGFIKDDKKAIDKYKKEHSHEWTAILGAGDFDIVEEEGNNEVGFEPSED